LFIKQTVAKNTTEEWQITKNFINPGNSQTTHQGIKMAFFNTSNPMLTILTGVITFFFVRALLSKALGKTSYGQKHADYVSVISAVIAAIVVSSFAFLRMVSTAIPYLIIVFLVILFSVLIFVGMGVAKDQILDGLKETLKNTYIWILIIVIIAWGASSILGQPLLEKQTPLTGFSTAEQEKVDQYDLGFVFAKPLLGFLFIFIIVGFAFYTVAKQT